MTLLVVCFALVLGMVLLSTASTAHASGTATGGLIIDGTGDITDTGGTYAYSDTDKTLMLNGYNGGVIRFGADNDVTVKLEPGTTNTITLNDSAVTEKQYGVYAAGNLTVTGNGTLNINMDISGAGDEITTEYGKALYGLYAKSLTVNGEINVNVNLTSNGFSCGMFATGDITVADKPSVEIKVNGGTGAGTYTQGESVTVTAEDKDGKVFAGWQDESGAIVSTQKEYTFTVAEGKTLTAVYEDAPAAKKGLSGGQIAGIVIGTLLLAGIGGFAIFWFAVKKKTFADLIAAIKALFTKKK